MEIDFNSKEYKRSRAAYISRETVEYFIMILVADAYLAKLLTSIGISDSLTGIISSFVTISFIFQIFSVILVKSKFSSKALSIGFTLVSNLFFTLLYFVPFIPAGGDVKKVIIIVSILIAYATMYVVQSIAFKWGNSYVEPKRRASFSANKEIISLASGIVFTAAVGYIVDKFEGIGNLNGGFLFIACAMIILNICNLISTLLIKKDDEKEHEAENVPFKEVLKNTIGNKNFRNVIIMTCLWDTARYFSIGFMGVYKTGDLMMSLFLIQLINMIANVCRMVLTRPFGEYSDKTSFAKGMEAGLCIAAAAFCVNIFTTPSNWWFIIIYTVLFSASYAGINQNSFNISYSYVPLNCITQAMAFKNTLSGICGFCASLVGGKILSVIQAGGNNVFGITMHGQQVLAVISFVLTAVAAMFIHFVISKQKVKKQ